MFKILFSTAYIAYMRESLPDCSLEPLFHALFHG